MVCSRSVLLLLALVSTYVLTACAFQAHPSSVLARVGSASSSRICANALDQDESESDSRRNFVQQSGLALASMILGFPDVSSASSETGKTIVITGSNSGIGFEAAKSLASQGNKVIMACRTLEKSKDAIARIIASGISSENMIPAECNLASLRSIDDFVKNLPTQKLDTICLNAGVSLNVDDEVIKRTEDGFELTVGTNHLGHFYLSHLLLPKLNTDTGRIIVTASGVHDPESPGGAQGKTATLGDLTGFLRDGKNFEMVDGNPYNGDKAYKDSKLCNVLFTRELQRRLDANPETKAITVNCFSPGLITSTGLFRNQNPFFSKAFDLIASKVARVAETPEWSGAALVYVSSMDTKGQYYLSPPGSSKYGDAAFGNQFKVCSVSKEAQDDAKAKRLWELSEKLVGISSL